MWMMQETNRWIGIATFPLRSGEINPNDVTPRGALQGDDIGTEKLRMRMLDKVAAHFLDGRVSSIIPINNSELEREFKGAIMLPVK